LGERREVFSGLFLGRGVVINKLITALRGIVWVVFCS
jgi:hypothetical protein